MVAAAEVAVVQFVRTVDVDQNDASLSEPCTGVCGEPLLRLDAVPFGRVALGVHHDHLRDAFGLQCAGDIRNQARRKGNRCTADELAVEVVHDFSERPHLPIRRHLEGKISGRLVALLHSSADQVGTRTGPGCVEQGDGEVKRGGVDRSGGVVACSPRVAPLDQVASLRRERGFAQPQCTQGLTDLSNEEIEVLKEAEGEEGDPDAEDE